MISLVIDLYFDYNARNMNKLALIGLLAWMGLSPLAMATPAEFETFAERLTDQINEELACNVTMGEPWRRKPSTKQGTFIQGEKTKTGTTDDGIVDEYRLTFYCDNKSMELTWKIVIINEKKVSQALVNEELDNNKTCSQTILNDYLAVSQTDDNPWYSWACAKAKVPANWR